jgi:hypothetical protein
MADLRRQVTAALPHQQGAAKYYAFGFRDAKTPVTTSAKPMKWKACGCSPKRRST